MSIHNEDILQHKFLQTVKIKGLGIRKSFNSGSSMLCHAREFFAAYILANNKIKSSWF